MGGSTAPDTNTASNSLFVCIPCHNEIEANREEALRYGWLVRQGQDPETVTVLRRGVWSRIYNDGTVKAGKPNG